jgi:hypothetical protein
VDYLQFCVGAVKFIAAATVRTMRFISNLLITIWFRRDPDLLEYMSSGFQSLKKLCQRYYMSFGEVPLESLEKKRVAAPPLNSPNPPPHPMVFATCTVLVWSTLTFKVLARRPCWAILARPKWENTVR